MKLISTLFLIGTLLVAAYASDPCSPSPCASNAICSSQNNVAVCACAKGFGGNALVNCVQHECLHDEQCSAKFKCTGGVCVDPCLNTCGVNARCTIGQVPERVPLCSCPPGYKGNPFVMCHNTPDNSTLCNPSPCGKNTKCEVINDVATCSCQKGYIGSGIKGCHHECESDNECPVGKSCSQFRCIRSCDLCAPTASCKTTGDHSVTCTCPTGFSGDPHKECKPECRQNSDCSVDKPACYYGLCKHPCNSDTCGENAECNLRDGLVPVCSCPKGMVGDPFMKCRPITEGDLCNPNVCGKNAKCTPGHDPVKGLVPICSCAPGHYGNPLSECIKGECASNNDCPSTRLCLGARCHNPCINQCGDGAGCEPRNHLAVCFCPPNTSGNPLLACTPLS